MNHIFFLQTAFDGFRGFFSFVPKCFASMGVVDVFDILYLSVILFFLLCYVIERHIGGAFIGIAVWGVIYGISCLLDFTAVRTIVGSVFSIGILVIIILFQPELRQMLGRMGTDSFRSIYSTLSAEKQHKTPMQDESIDAIAQATSELSRLKTGALIVFERNDQLGDVVRSGIELDAKVTPYLLRNIFFDKSPLHDGAVVIRDRRICAAGCLLQLSRRSDLDPSLGTRHRAAIGMSENSDAIVIVVSEETGIISVAYRRQITRNFTYSTLKSFLYKVMLNQSDETVEMQEKEEEADE